MCEKTHEIAALVDGIRPLLAGRPAEVQGAALADLLATWLAGHHVQGNRVATNGLRNTLLTMHVEMVRKLVPVNARTIGTTP